MNGTTNPKPEISNNKNEKNKHAKGFKMSHFAKQLFVPAGIAKSRLAICNNCEHYTAAKFCKKCHCIMPAKVHFAGTRCPIKKWGSFVKPTKHK